MFQVVSIVLDHLLVASLRLFGLCPMQLSCSDDYCRWIFRQADHPPMSCHRFAENPSMISSYIAITSAPLLPHICLLFVSMKVASMLTAACCIVSRATAFTPSHNAVFGVARRSYSRSSVAMMAGNPKGTTLTVIYHYSRNRRHS